MLFRDGDYFIYFPGVCKVTYSHCSIDVNVRDFFWTWSVLLFSTFDDVGDELESAEGYRSVILFQFSA